MWHASVSVLGPTGVPVPRERLTPRTRARLREVAAGLLRGVGAGPDRWDARSNGVLHLRRALSAAELASLDPAWLAIPAVDIG